MGGLPIEYEIHIKLCMCSYTIFCCCHRIILLEEYNFFIHSQTIIGEILGMKQLKIKSIFLCQEDIRNKMNGVPLKETVEQKYLGTVISPKRLDKDIEVRSSE